MQSFRTALVLVLASLVPLAAAHGTSLDYQGYAFETGGFPPSAVGDTLRIPVVVTEATADLGFDFASEEVTGWVTGLVSSGSTDLGGGVLRIDYSSGRIEFHRDPARDHDFGVSPPNATVPASFTNGELCLSGSLTDFVLFLDSATSTGAYQGNVTFDAGACLALLHASRAEGFTFGGLVTRTGPGGGAIPEGYDLSVDGFLQATGIPALCPLPCLAITEAKLEFARHEVERCGPSGGKFEIEGNFSPCSESTPVDPARIQVRLRIGDFVQVLPPGSFEPDEHHSRHPSKWEYEGPEHGTGITEVTLERRRDRSWEFEIEGRGIPRVSLLPADRRLQLEIVLDDMGGRVEVMLEQQHKRLFFHGDDDACRPAHHPHELDASPGGPGSSPTASPPLVNAVPNPFNATTTLAVQTSAIGDLRLRLFDVRGRLVRTLHAGYLPAGVHRFTWDGTDAQGRAVASGIYIYRVESSGQVTNGKLVVAK